MGITPTACLLDSARRRSQKMGGGLPGISSAQVIPRRWRPQLAYLMARHANHLDRWQLGADGSDAFVTEPADAARSTIWSTRSSPA